MLRIDGRWFRCRSCNTKKLYLACVLESIIGDAASVTLSKAANKKKKEKEKTGKGDARTLIKSIVRSNGSRTMRPLYRAVFNSF